MTGGLRGVLGTLGLVLPSGQRRLIFRPDTAEPWGSFAGVPGRVVEIGTADGLALRCWWCPPPAEAGRVVLYLHGNGGHLGYRAPRVEVVRERGMGMLLLSYRGYGGNAGRPTERGLARDAAAAWRWLRGEGIAAGRVVVWGESLGTAVATGLVAGLGGGGPAALVLETPFTSMADIARGMVRHLPVDLLLRDRFDSAARIGGLRPPLLVVSGERDGLTPPEMGRALFEAAGSTRKRLVVVPGANHGEVPARVILDALAELAPG